MSNKIEIKKKGKVNIKWSVKPVDYSTEKEEEIIKKFSDKYGIPKENVRIEPVFHSDNIVTLNSEDGNIENVQDPKFQQKLFKIYLEEKEAQDYDFDKILEIDDQINNEIDYESYDKHKKYLIKWIKWSNFMSYGENNFIDLTNLDGLILLTSNPANQGGKTTFCIDLFRFLLFGKVTSRESDWTLSKVFNKHLPEATEVVVEGCVCIDGVDYVIKRTVTRPALKKRTDKSKVVNTVNYYRLVNDTYVDIEDEENENGSGTLETNKIIKDAIGNEKDFDLMICIDSDNLKGLISLKDTDRGRLIARWMGMLPLEEKEKIAKDMYLHTVVPSLVSNRYSKESLEEKKGILLSEIETYKAKIEESDTNINGETEKLSAYSKSRDTLLSSKMEIDEKLLNIDVATLEESISRTVTDGKEKRAILEARKKELEELKDVTFDDGDYNKKVDRKEILASKLATLKVNMDNAKKSIESLKNGEFCPTCGARLKNVDNTKAIKEKEAELEEIIANGKETQDKYVALKKEIESLNEVRELNNKKVQLKLLCEKIEVDIDLLTSKYKEKKRMLKDISDNKTAIENNNKITTELAVVDQSIKAINANIERLKNEKNQYSNTIENNKKAITEVESLMKTLEGEESLIRNWKLYLEMIGKKGISKMVIRNALPLVNGELKRLLNGVCDFVVEVSINDKNDVEFSLIHDKIRSSLASGSGFEQTVASLALRSVLSKISNFSKPSFVVFDEVLGGVSDENYDQVKSLYDKIATDYKTVFQISHLKAITDWHNQIVSIEKDGNISRIASVRK